MTERALSSTPSGLWQQVAGARLALLNTVAAHRHRYRGRSWYLLSNALGRRQYRVSEGVYRLLQRLDGRRTLAEAWASVFPQETGDSPDRNELVTVVAQLQAAGMLTSDQPVNLERLAQQRRQRQRVNRLARWARPLAPRFALLDPDDLLRRMASGFGWLFHPLVFWLWLGLVLFAGTTAWQHGGELVAYGSQRVFDPVNLLLLWLLYPPVKILHELAHGLAVKHWGGEVHEMGITLLVFMPVPFVEASDATTFASKYRRMAVGAGGIMVEALLASLALFAWLELPQGLWRDVAFNLMLIGGVSTLLFNGNPLLRFDGYYVLSDALEIPNLATRSARYYGYLCKRYLFGLGSAWSPVTAPGERWWFLFFGGASTLYRLFISLGIAVFLIQTLFFVGVVLAVWLLSVALVLPLLRQLRFVLRDPQLTGKRVRALSVVILPIALLGLLLFWLPAPLSTKSEGIVLAPEAAIIRAGANGFLAKQHAAPGDRVRAGDLLFELRDPALDTDIRVISGQLAEQAARLDQTRLTDRVQTEITRAKLEELRSELNDLLERRRRLRIESPAAGTLAVPRAADLLGRFFRQGAFLGHVIDQQEITIRVAVPQAEGARIRAGVDQVVVRFAGAFDQPVSAELRDEVPAGADTLPSAILGRLGGGAIAVDARDQSGMATLERVFAFDVALPYRGDGRFVGRRAFVAFEHASGPLLGRWYEALRRQVMARLQI